MLRFVCFFLFCSVAQSFELPATSSQCIVGTAENWDSSHVALQLYQKVGSKWQRSGPAWNGRLGKNGLIWGRGLHPLPANAATKKEGDGRTPAGVFRIGGAWGNDPSIRKHPQLAYRQVTSRDLWVEDAASQSYNKHLVLSHEPATAWEKKQQMKQNDPAHALKLFIAHNATPGVVKGAGSSIFFHIWRGGGINATTGCTTMEETKLRNLIAIIDPARQPLYLIMPRAEYQRVRRTWRLP